MDWYDWCPGFSSVFSQTTVFSNLITHKITLNWLSWFLSELRFILYCYCWYFSTASRSLSLCSYFWISWRRMCISSYFPYYCLKAINWKCTSFSGLWGCLSLSLCPMGCFLGFSFTVGGFFTFLHAFFVLWSESFHRILRPKFVWFKLFVFFWLIVGTWSFQWGIVHSFHTWPFHSFIPCTSGS